METALRLAQRKACTGLTPARTPPAERRAPLGRSTAGAVTQTIGLLAFPALATAGQEIPSVWVTGIRSLTGGTTALPGVGRAPTRGFGPAPGTWGVQMRARRRLPARLAAVPAGALDRHRIVLFSLWFLIFAALVASPDPAMAQGTVTVTAVTSEVWDDPDLAPDEEGALVRFTVHRTSTACCYNPIDLSISESGGDMVDWTTRTYSGGRYNYFEIRAYTVNDNQVEGDSTITLTVEPRSNYVVGTPASQSITIRDNDSPQTPSAPRARWEHREDGVLVSWGPPASTGSSAITRYEYRMRVYGDNWSGEWTSLPASARSLTFNNLGHRTEYELDVRAVNGAGGGGVARIRDLVWLRVPSPPGFRAEPGDATGTVKVSVSSGPTALGVGGYEMRWKRSDSSWDTAEPSALGDGWRYLVLGDGLYAIVGAAGFGLKLDPGVSYDFEVRSRSQHPSRGVIYSPTASASAVAKEKPVGPFVPGSVKFSIGKPAGGQCDGNVGTS